MSPFPCIVNCHLLAPFQTVLPLELELPDTMLQSFPVTPPRGYHSLTQMLTYAPVSVVLKPTKKLSPLMAAMR